MIMSSLEFIGPPKILGPPLNLVPQPNLIFCSGPPQLFWSEIFKSPLKLGGDATMRISLNTSKTEILLFRPTSKRNITKHRISELVASIFSMENTSQIPGPHNQ